jgi:hypothetical protein
VYSELRLCLDAVGVICVVLGICLFSGTKRETLWDKNNLVGLLLIGIALSTHGGFDTVLRSSPHATFSGYVLAWSRSSGHVPSASGWIWLYDLGFPPTKAFEDSPYRAIYIPSKRNLPSEAWNTDEIWLLQATYRTRDLQAVRIEGRPIPSPKTSGLRAWTWQYDEPLLRPACETIIGLGLILGAVILLMRRVSPNASPLHIVHIGDDQMTR